MKKILGNLGRFLLIIISPVFGGVGDSNPQRPTSWKTGLVAVLLMVTFIGALVLWIGFFNS